jgi:hypothetical protein
VRSRATVQSPSGYDRQNLTAPKLGTRLAAGASAALRGNWRTVLADQGYRFNIHPLETAAGLTDADLTFGYDPADVRRYGGVLDDDSAPTRTINSAAIITSANANNGRAWVPEGTYWIDSGTDWSACPSLILSGVGADLTTIKGDGDLFVLTDATLPNNKAPEFRDFSIENDAVRGKLFAISTGADVNRIKWSRMEFRNAEYHVWSDDICVGHTYSDCRFNGAQQASRFYAGLWAFVEKGSYVWFNKVGLYVAGDQSATNNSYGSVYEQNDDSAVILAATNGDVNAFSFHGTHFEANGKVTGAADVSLTTTTANRVRGVRFHSCSWYLPSFSAAQTERIFVDAGGGGNLDNLRVSGGYVSGAVPICSNVAAVTVDDDVEFQNPAARPAFTRTDLRVPLSAAGYKGENFTAGATAGSGAVVATITPPTGVKVIDFTVMGNAYNGAANTHDGHLVGRYVVSGSRIIVLKDTNHSAGANQGFVATWTGAALQIANKAAMTNTQSGDVECVFHA